MGRVTTNLEPRTFQVDGEVSSTQVVDDNGDFRSRFLPATSTRGYLLDVAILDNPKLTRLPISRIGSILRWRQQADFSQKPIGSFGSIAAGRE